MNQTEEDALIERAIVECSTTLSVDWRGAIRLAIRAAYAKGREDAAKVCEEFEPKSFTTAGLITRAMCAAAIRKGE